MQQNTNRKEKLIPIHNFAAASRIVDREAKRTYIKMERHK